MSQAEIAKALVRPPFANYDLVVYFGCGLFSLPFLKHYVLTPLSIESSVNITESPGGFTASLIFTLTALIFIYIVGHAVAYLGSQIIEKSADTFFGKTSAVVLLSSRSTPVTRNRMIRRHIRRQFRSAFSSKQWLASFVRALFHAPVIILYVALILLGVFGYYGSRVPRYIVSSANEKLKQYCPHCSISMLTRWFKPLEAVIINHNPSAAARMYNYLIISGLFRSVSVVLLFSIWMEAYYFFHRLLMGHSHLIEWVRGSVLAPETIVLPALGFFYFVSLFSYLKFQRRYVEEAIFALAVEKA